MSTTQQPWQTSPDETASQKPISPGQWAPHIDDPDPPDIMSPAEIETAARKTKDLMRSKTVKPPSRSSRGS